MQYKINSNSKEKFVALIKNQQITDEAINKALNIGIDKVKSFLNGKLLIAEANFLKLEKLFDDEISNYFDKIIKTK